jgi:hypothetical protein
MDLKLEHIQEITEIAVMLNIGRISDLGDSKDFYYPLIIRDVLPRFNFTEHSSEFSNLDYSSSLVCKFEKDIKENIWKLKEIRK